MQLIKKVLGKISYWKRTVVFFVWKPDYKIANSNSLSDLFFSEIQSISDFPLGFVSDQVEQEYLVRLSKQHFCCVLTHYNQIVTYGWINPLGRHYIGELNVWVDLKEDTEMLYDFATNENYRGQGLYPYLLQKICTRNAKNKLIYILSNNNSSRKGILKANFRMFGVVKGINKSKVQRLLSKI
jgi:hypothetical protein